MTDIPFMPINKTEMTINNDAEPVREVAPEGKKLRFRWTTEETVEENERGKRWMTTAPMASNGQYIFTLVQYYEGD
jgi:hypothetical protein